jgi:hypothetical protein
MSEYVCALRNTNGTTSPSDLAPVLVSSFSAISASMSDSNSDSVSVSVSVSDSDSVSVSDSNSDFDSLCL